jgi:lactoylglutathione lyase
MQIDYIALFVTDVERAVGFYRDVLEMDFPKPIHNNGCEGRSGQLKLGLYHRSWLPQLFGDQTPNLMPQSPAEQPSQGYPAFPFLLSITVTDLDRAHERLQQAQVQILQPPQVMPWGQRILFFQDPDGNLLELVESTR